jgi:biopolymer transport protein TolR
VSRSEAVQAIKEKQARHPDQAVVIAADKDVRYESVLEVMDMLQQNQVKKVGLLAKPRAQ